MKNKLFFLFLTLGFFLLASLPYAQAEDCMHDPINDQDWNAVVTTGVRIRNIPCMETSSVVATAPVGEILHVIAETDGYYKIERADGTVGWIGQWLVEKTTDTFKPAKAKNDPLFDVAGHRYETAIRYLDENKIASGYPDGSFKPDSTINRAEFVKIIMGAVYAFDPSSKSDDHSAVFSDVEGGDWYVPYVREALSVGLIGGYPDGSFKPATTINFAEASKILVNAFDIDASAYADQSPWYKPYVSVLQNQSYIPSTIKTLDHSLTRGEMAELIWRVKESVHSKAFSSFEM